MYICTDNVNVQRGQTCQIIPLKYIKMSESKMLEKIIEKLLSANMVIS